MIRDPRTDTAGAAPTGPSIATRRGRRRPPSFSPALLALEERVVLSDGPSGPTGGGGDPGGVGYSFTNWPVAQLQGFEYRAENTYPIVGPGGQQVRADEDWVFRDPFPVTDLDGRLARIGGWYVMAGLAAPRGAPTLDEYSYIISKDGVNWQEGGTLISIGQPGVLGDQLFSGDLRYDEANDRLIIYYTPVEGTNTAEYVQGPSGRHMRQEIAVSEATPVPSDTGLVFTNYVHHGLELVPDGKWYATPEAANTETEVYGFRDPWFFRDPESGLDFVLFVGNWGTDQTVGYPEGAVTGDAVFPEAGPMDVVAGAPRSDGVVGIAVATDESLLNFEMLPPMFGAIGVNTQLELPHFVHQDGRYYLFFTTHNRTFIDELKYDYPEGLYGFVSDDLQGPYEPLNGTGLVLANPPQEPLQNYAWKVVPTGPGTAEVFSFINKNGSGTISPAVALRIEGNTAVIDEYQPPTGLPVSPTPALPLLFGVSETAPRGSTPPMLTGGLDPSSDSGTSDSDGLTSDSTPTFSGTAPAGSTVRLLAGESGSDGRDLVGRTTAGPDGRWSLTVGNVLPDGAYAFHATTGVSGPSLASDLGTINVDAKAPAVTDIRFDPRAGRITITLQNDPSGVDLDRLDDVSAYRVTARSGGGPTPVSVTNASTNGLNEVVLTLGGGGALATGEYELTVEDRALADLAGNSPGGFTKSWTHVSDQDARPARPAPPSFWGPWFYRRPTFATTRYPAFRQGHAPRFVSRRTAQSSLVRQAAPAPRWFGTPFLAGARTSPFFAARRWS